MTAYPTVQNHHTLWQRPRRKPNRIGRTSGGDSHKSPSREQLSTTSSLSSSSSYDIIQTAAQQQHQQEHCFWYAFIIFFRPASRAQRTLEKPPRSSTRGLSKKHAAAEQHPEFCWWWWWTTRREAFPSLDRVVSEGRPTRVVGTARKSPMMPCGFPDLPGLNGTESGATSREIWFCVCYCYPHFIASVLETVCAWCQRWKTSRYGCCSFRTLLKCNDSAIKCNCIRFEILYYLRTSEWKNPFLSNRNQLTLIDEVCL